MTIEKFHASVQYNDFEGTSAADVADRNAPREWLKKNIPSLPDKRIIILCR